MENNGIPILEGTIKIIILTQLSEPLINPIVVGYLRSVFNLQVLVMFLKCFHGTWQVLWYFRFIVLYRIKIVQLLHNSITIYKNKIWRIIDCYLLVCFSALPKNLLFRALCIKSFLSHVAQIWVITEKQLTHLDALYM